MRPSSSPSARCASRALPKPELGHLKKAGAAADAHARRVPGRRRRRGGSSRSATGHGRVVREGRARQGLGGRSKGKGFQGTIRRHSFHRGPVSHGSHNVRAPGSIGASATPARVLKGVRMPGQMGEPRVTQRGLEVVDVDAERNLLIVGAPFPGPTGALVEVERASDERESQRSRRAKAPKLGAPGQRGPPAADLRRALPRDVVYEAARAEQLARRRGTAATKTRGQVRAAAPSPGARRAPAVPASARAALRTGPVEARPSALPARLHGQGQPQGAPPRASGRAQPSRRARASRSSMPRLRGALDAQGGRRSRRLGCRAPVLVLLDRGRGDLREVVSQHRPRARASGIGRRRRRRARRRLASSSPRPRSRRSGVSRRAAPKASG